jgi:hypothetical protein
MFDKPKQKRMLKGVETLQNIVWRSIRYPKDKATSLQSQAKAKNRSNEERREQR